MTMDEVTGVIGRERETASVAEALKQGHSVLLRGRPGIGKRTLLRRVRCELADRVCLWPDMTTARTMAHTIAEQAHETVGLLIPEHLIPQRWRAQARQSGHVRWDRVRRTLLRLPVSELIEMVAESLRGHRVIVFIDTLEVPPTQANALQDLAQVCQLAACIEDSNRRARVMRLIWRFQVHIELGPLRPPESKEIAEQWLAKHPQVSFDSERVRQAFLRAVVQDSGGVPAAIEGMLRAATADGHVSRSNVREYQHEAAAVYWDMTPLLLVVAAGLMAMRYISRGADIQELVVLAGVGTSLVWIILYFARRFSSGGARR